MPGWDADRYQRQFGFVSAMAGGVLELLDAGPGEVVLDLGGAGNLQAILDALGAALAEAGLPQPASPWYFPTPARQAALLPRVLARVDQLAAPRLRRDGGWFADYWRLRFVAVAGPPATEPG